MNWKPEVVRMCGRTPFLRWWKCNHKYATTLEWTSFFSSHSWGYVGLRLDWKEFVVGISYFSTATSRNVEIHLLPMVELVIHFRKGA